MEYIRKPDFLNVTWTGDLTSVELFDVNAQLTRLHTEEGASRFLIDLSAIERISATAVDILRLPAIEYFKAHVNRDLLRVAVVKPPSSEAEDLIKFYVTACLNRGWMVKMLPDPRVAIEWLALEQCFQQQGDPVDAN